MATNGNKVCAIPELLESILLELPIKDLLLVQRVSKGWQSTVETSFKIQQALYYKERPLSSLDPDNTLDINPFFYRVLHMILHHGSYTL